MANLGKLRLQTDNTYKGEFHSLKHQFPIQLLPCESPSEKHPVYRVYSGTTELGAVWENTAAETGQVYYSMALNDPSFDRPLYTKLFQDRTDGGILHITFG